MTIKQIFSICLIILSLSNLLFSQSEFIERGNNGVGGGLGLSASNEASGFNLYAGYSFQGFIDGKLTYTKLNGGKIQGGFLTPSITYYFFKQEDSERVPTLGVSIGFCSYTIKETKTFVVPDTPVVTWRSYQKTEESKINALILGLAVQKRTGYWKMLFFEPFLGADLAIKKRGWEFSFHVGVAIGTRIVNGPLLVLIPALERRSGNSTFSLLINTVF